MFDVGWSELLLIGVVALIVIGPDDLPKLFHTLGRITARARAMAREFTSAMEDAAKSSGLDEAGKTLREVNTLTSKKSLGLDALDRAASSFEKWDPKRPAQRLMAKPAAQPDPAQPDPASRSDSAAGDAAAAPLTAAAVSPPEPMPMPEPEPVEAGPVTPPVTEAPGRRQLHASRRSGSGGA